MKRLSFAAALIGCALAFGAREAVPVARGMLQPEIDAMLAEGQKAVASELLSGERIPTNFVGPIRAEANADPWGSLERAERLVAIGSAENPYALPLAVAILKEKDFRFEPAAVWPKASPISDGPKWCVGLVAQAAADRDRAVARLTPQERQAAYARGEEIVKEFGPQESPEPEAEQRMQADMDFLKAAWEKVDWAQMARAAQRLLLLADPERQRLLAASLKRMKLKASKVPGVRGQVLFEQKTPQGWAIVGGPAGNAYDVKEPVALIVDVGGNDAYSGRVATPAGPEFGVSAVLDLAGDDLYEGASAALATGRLGCGIIVDYQGNDRYTAGFGGVGVGLGGYGIVVDEAGSDAYRGGQYAIGAAIAGIGCVLDRKGSDEYVCDVYGIGLGGSCGLGIVSDLAGDDRYRCGFKEPSGYNAGDAPNAKPGDPNFQYEGWGIGIGLGRRVYPFDKDKYQRLTSAGGIGIVVDSRGNDVYEASNFALGCGYFFGLGVFADLQGNDHYKAARYGLASGAHYAEGLFLDYFGNDVYDSTGPTYNCGCSWDRSLFLFVDAAGNDVYNLQRSAGPARGDIGSLGIAADLRGDDVYNLSSMPAGNSRNGLSAFLDGEGNDRYNVPGGQLANGLKQKVGLAGLFWDR